MASRTRSRRRPARRKISRKRPTSRRRPTATARRPRLSAAKRSAAARKGWARRRRAGTARKRNPLYRKRRSGKFTGRKTYKGAARLDQSYWARRKRRYGKSGRRRRTKTGKAIGKLKTRRSRRRRNPNGGFGELMNMDTWVGAGQIALGAVGSLYVANKVASMVPPIRDMDPAIKRFVMPLAIAASGIGLGMIANFLPVKNKAALGKKLVMGGFVAGAIKLIGEIGKQVGIPLGFEGMGDYVQMQGYSDYVQMQGYGTQAQVEAGSFGGYGTQAQVEAGSFGGLGADQTFGPTF